MNTESDLVIEQADPDDPRFHSAFGGQRHLFADRLERHRKGLGVVLVGWLRNEPVGHVYLWLEPPEEPEIQKHLPGVPLLVNVWVKEDVRNRRVGTALITAAEGYLRQRGDRQVALGVALDNPDAMRLYERLGYRQWRYGDIETAAEEFLDNGDRLRQPEMCRVFVKRL